MEYLCGIVLALAAAGAATAIGFDRERVFYPTLLIVIATYYVLFAAMGYSLRCSSGHVVILESLVAAGFLLVALLAFKISLWLAVAGLVGHGVFDFVHDRFLHNPGVPHWWPGFCLVFDVVAGVFLSVLLIRRASPRGANLGHDSLYRDHAGGHLCVRREMRKTTHSRSSSASES